MVDADLVLQMSRVLVMFQQVSVVAIFAWKFVSPQHIETLIASDRDGEHRIDMARCLLGGFLLAVLSSLLPRGNLIWQGIWYGVNFPVNPPGVTIMANIGGTTGYALMLLPFMRAHFGRYGWLVWCGISAALVLAVQAIGWSIDPRYTDLLMIGWAA
jgi:hypothetical protein